jgi:DNA-binding winged helix-turn-helix (wHTH) protein
LSPKAYDLLLVLIQNRTRAMSRAELQQHLWPSTYVLDTNLASLIAEVRRALIDASEDPRYIRTVHRFGYWFIAPVQESSDTPPPPAPAHIRHWLIWDLKQVPLSEGENIIGRAPDAGVWIDAPGVSRHHARITITASNATLEDLESKNGTFVRGERVAGPRILNDGDQIRLGPVLLTLRIPSPGGSTETVRIG